MRRAVHGRADLVVHDRRAERGVARRRSRAASRPSRPGSRVRASPATPIPRRPGKRASASGPRGARNSTEGKPANSSTSITAAEPVKSSPYQATSSPSGGGRRGLIGNASSAAASAASSRAAVSSGDARRGGVEGGAQGGDAAGRAHRMGHDPAARGGKIQVGGSRGAASVFGHLAGTDWPEEKTGITVPGRGSANIGGQAGARRGDDAVRRARRTCCAAR